MILQGEGLTVNSVVKVARFGEHVDIDKNSLERVARAREKLEERIASGETIYGINTGLGDLVRVRVEEENLRKLQTNLVRSHASGVGEPLDDEIVRGAMLIRANSLLRGNSGVRPEVIVKLVDFLNHSITPIVPRFGSVGASGDLAPLAHVALALTGEGKVRYGGEVRDASEVLESLDLEPLELREKEGLALLNGTAVMASIASIAVHDSYEIFKNSLISTAMSFESLRGTDCALDERIMLARPHPGQIRVARILRSLLKDSDIIKEARKDRVQDAYTLRCVPQVYGAILDTVDYVREVVEREINSVTDNPLIFEDDVISGGNFHGEPLALVMDFLAIALADMGNMVERRIARLVDSKLSGLPPFLIENSGLNSGLMIPQYTAAALCNRNKVLAYPASVDTIPTSANQEDHVSMGMNSALKLREIVENLKYIVAIEYLCANQALRIRGHSARSIDNALHAIGIEKIEEDVVFSELIERIKSKMDSGEIVREVEKVVKITL